jgi:hypothetical protein
MEVGDFRLLYTNPPESDEPAVLSVRGKLAQDIFGECIIPKNKGPKFFKQAGTDIFHTLEELHSFLVMVASRATAHIQYHLPESSEAAAWLKNMPTDEDVGWNANAMDKDIYQDLADILPAGPIHPPSLPLPPPLNPPLLRRSRRQIKPLAAGRTPGDRSRYISPRIG